ncbi:hypothetical protein [Bombiscardovia coagulans]|uniref:Lipoprotein n=1 Tax=Bombiscardovia coagulans TaxID=686666 RepID=A0A261EPI9_9BIFI|nr:hypothetical protein [Bombiscardovia coagulans]OZG48770.1 hypothetical protein BOCO_1257 [Bombiscardovia coagulans]
MKIQSSRGVTGVLLSLTVVVVITMALSACGTSGNKTQDMNAKADSDHSAYVPDTKDSGQESVPENKNPSNRKDVERYRDCLKSKGIPASIGPDGQIVYEFTEEQGSVGISSDNTDYNEAQASCKVEVPGYRDPDYNTK